MTTSKVLDPTKVKQMEDRLRQEYGISIETVNEDGFPITSENGNGNGHCAHAPVCEVVAKDPAACKCCHAERRRAVGQATETRKPFAFRCRTGLDVVCVPLADEARPYGAVFVGKSLSKQPLEEAAMDIQSRLSPFEMDSQEVVNAVRGHPCAAGNILDEAARSISQWPLDSLVAEAISHGGGETKSASADAQREIGRGRIAPEEESDLIKRVLLGDRKGANAVLKTILGKLLFIEPPGSPALKPRLIELMALLSRAASEAGVNVNTLLERNFIHFSKILNSESDIDLSLSISRALTEYLDICIRHARRHECPVRTVMRYIELNYMKDLTVQELAKQAHLSPSRISHLFKEKLNTTMMEAVIHARMEHAKLLLQETQLYCTEIAYRVGYRDQSYFTRVFHTQEGVTPHQYRILHRNQHLNLRQIQPGAAG